MASLKTLVHPSNMIPRGVLNPSPIMPKDVSLFIGRWKKNSVQDGGSWSRIEEFITERSELENLISNLTISNQIWNLVTVFWLIWNNKRSSVCFTNQLKKCNCNPDSVRFKQASEKISLWRELGYLSQGCWQLPASIFINFASSVRALQGKSFSDSFLI